MEQWEYCVLYLYMRKSHGGNPGALISNFKAYGYDCWITYHSTTGEVILERLAEMEKPQPFNPFDKAIGLLGAAGWEMVAVQHGNVVPLENYSRTGILADFNTSSYFKRHVLSGRKVNEPKLNLS